MLNLLELIKAYILGMCVFFMDLKRGIIFGIVLWVAIFLEVIFLMQGFNLENGDWAYHITHYILVAIFVIIASIYYFRGRRVMRDIKEGFKAGILFVIIGIILDALIRIPFFVKSLSFFFDAGIWMGYLEIIVITCIIGAIRD